MTGQAPASITLDVRTTIVRTIQLHTDEPTEEAGYIADDIMVALQLGRELTVKVPRRRRGEHEWPCSLFYTGNWDGERPRARCSCPTAPDGVDS
jgi:hypothetical protein